MGDEQKREAIESIIRRAAEYGWRLAHLGYDKPDPQIEWQDGVPVIVSHGTKRLRP